MKDELQKFIKPGEFTFCGRCGNNVRYGNKDFMCNDCKRMLFRSTERNFGQTDEDEFKEKYEAKISTLIREHREKLAELRMKISAQIP